MASIFLIPLLLLAVGLGAGCSGPDEATASAAEPVAGTASPESSQAASVTPSTQSVAASGSDSVTSETTESETDATVTGTSYESSDKSITISRVQTGEGADAVTFYVVDILLAVGTDLRSAFSSGEYGGREEDTSDIALANDAIVAINGDYYSARDDGVIIRNGVLYRNVPARTGLAIYEDGTMQVYDETEVSAEELLADGVWNTYSFGPALVADRDVVDGIDSYEADPNARHGIQGTNPRTGIGVIDADHFVFVVVDGRDLGYSRGVTVTEFAHIFLEFGCSTAYNLDGGGSSTLYFMGEVVNQPSQDRGERSISDILFVG